VGTVTEIHDYLRLLFARAGTPYCPDHGLPLQAQTVSQMVDAVLALPEDTKADDPGARWCATARASSAELFADMQAQGYVRFRIGGVAYEVDNLPKLKKTEKHDIDVVVDRLKVRQADARPPDQQRLAESFEAALRLAEGRAIALEMDTGRQEHLFNAKFACPVCNYSLQELEPRLFSFNSPMGACPKCDGLGHHGVLRPGARGGLPHAEPGQRRDQGLGPAQPGYYFRCWRAWPRTTASTSRRPSSRCRARCSTPCCTARARTRSGSAT
jgi:excinuclease ABC subunit A